MESKGNNHDIEVDIAEQIIDNNIQSDSMIELSNKKQNNKQTNTNSLVENSIEVSHISNQGTSLPSFIMHSRKLMSKSFVLFVVLSFFALLYIESISFLLFHIIIELFTSFIGYNMFLWSFGTRAIVHNHFLHFICIGQVVISTLDFFHALTYNGMHVFDNVSWHDPLETPTQLWIAARFIQSCSLLIAPIFIVKQQHVKYWYEIVTLIYMIIVGLVFILLITETFPSCLTKDGLTTFKKVMEYIISSIFIMAIIHLLYQRKSDISIEKPHQPIFVRNKEIDALIRGENLNSNVPSTLDSNEHIDLSTNDTSDNNNNNNNTEHTLEPILVWLIVHIVFAVAAELIFTLYTKPTDRFNMIAHIVRFYSTLALFDVCFAGIYKNQLTDIKNDLDIKSKQLLYYNSVLAAILNKEDAKTEILSPRLLKFVRDNATDRFQSLISHEIRTPLNAIIGLAEILKESDLQPNDANMVDTMYHCGISLVALLNDLLDIGKIQSKEIILKMTLFNLTVTTKRVLTLFDAMGKKKSISLIYEQSVSKLINDKQTYFKLNDNIFVYGDELRYTQIIRNLLSNAIKFTPVRGNIKIQVQVRCDEEIDKFLSHSEVHNIKVRIKIIDDGNGIPEHKIKNIFHPFKQIDDNSLHNHVQGTGLGLTICNGLVKCMDGDIGVYNNSNGKGCTFYVNIPFKIGHLLSEIDDPLIDLANKQQMFTRASLSGMPVVQNMRIETLKNAESKEHSREGSIVKEHVRILLVEDSGVNQKVQSRMLNLIFKTIPTKKLILDVAENGLEALSMICRCNFHQTLEGVNIDNCTDEAYDIILMDQMMPIMGGLEATKEIRRIEKFKNISISDRLIIIAQTGLLSSDITNIELYNDFIAKPISKHGLTTIITKYIK